jgi:hypothetical protein
MIKSLCGNNVFPSSENPFVPKEFRPLSLLIMKNRLGTFDPETFIARNLYPKCLYDKIPSVEDKKIEEWFFQSLHNEVGVGTDGFLFMGEYKE